MGGRTIEVGWWIVVAVFAVDEEPVTMAWLVVVWFVLEVVVVVVVVVVGRAGRAGMPVAVAVFMWCWCWLLWSWRRVPGGWSPT